MQKLQTKVIAAASLIISVVAAATAQAEPVTYVFDPNDPVQYAALLSSNTNINAGFSVSANGSDLVISADGTQQANKGLGFLVPFTVAGDFTARAKVTLNGNFGAGQASGFAFMGPIDAFPASVSSGVFFGRPSNAAANQFVGFGSNLGQPITQVFPGLNPSATLEVVRSGNTLSDYIDFGTGQFTLVSSKTFSGIFDTMTFNIGFTTSTPTVESMTMSNFTVAYDNGVPAPGALALLGFGLVGLGAMRKRKAA